MIAEHRPESTIDLDRPAPATAAADVELEADAGALGRSRALVAAEAKPLTLSAASVQLRDAARAAVADPGAMAGLVTALHQASPVLMATARGDDGRKPLSALCTTIAAAIEGVKPGGTPDELRVRQADAMIDPVLRATDKLKTLEQLAVHLRDDDDLQRALAPLRDAIGTLRSFSDTHAPARFTTDVGALKAAADRLDVKVSRADLDGKLTRAHTELFDQFDLMYRALEQAEAEVPQARGFIDALQALEAAIASGRKPNAFAAAAMPKLDAFMDGLRAVLARGPFGSTRMATDVLAPLRHVLGSIENVGTVLGGETRDYARDYATRVDKAEDPAATAQLIADHTPAPPVVDTRTPAPDWTRPLEASASEWLVLMRQSAHPQMSRPRDRVLEAKTVELGQLLGGVAGEIPAAQTLATRLRDIPTFIGRPDPQKMLASIVADTEAARSAFWTAANGYAVAKSGPDFEQNLTLQWLSAINDRIAGGVGWAYRLTEAGVTAGATHEKQLDRSIDEWNTPEVKPITLTLQDVSKQLEVAASAAVADPTAMPGLVAALREASPVLMSTARDPARKELSALCMTMAAAIEAVGPGGTPEELRAKLADAIIDPALRAYDKFRTLEQLAEHMSDDDDLRRSLSPLGQALSVLRNYGDSHAPARFQTDVSALKAAADRLYVKVHRADLDGKLTHKHTDLFDQFNAMYRALEQAEAEIPEARGLIDGLQAMEAAMESGRKPNAFATAALPKLDAFMDGLRTILGRGPFGTIRMATDVWSPLQNILGSVANVGTVLGGESRTSANEYATRRDPAEDPKQTEALIERHAPPAPDLRAPPPAWAPPLETAAYEWLGTMRVVATTGRAAQKSIDVRTATLRASLEAAVAVLPSAQKLAWRITDIGGTIGRTEEGSHMKLALSRYADEADAARKELALEANAFGVQQPGGISREQNQALDLLLLADESIGEAIGWAYRLTDAGAKAGGLHDKQVDRSIDEWNTPDPPPADPSGTPPAA